MAALPPKIWMVSHFKPYRSPFDPEDMMTFNLVHFSGYCEHPLNNTLGQSFMEYAKENRMGYLALATMDCNGIGPLEELENLKVESLVATIVQTLLNPKFGFGPNNRIILTAYSWGGWFSLICTSLSEQLREIVGGMLLMAPADGCFLPVFQDVLLQLEAMQDNQQAQGMARQLVEGHVVRLDASFGPMKKFPMSNPFQMSSWKYEVKRLDLSNLVFPITLVVGTEDPRVKASTVEAIFAKLPAGNKRLLKIDGLTHDYSSKSLFWSTLRPELERIAMAATPNLALPVNQTEDAMMDGLDEDSWALIKKPNKKRAYIYLTTGRTFFSKDDALAHQEEEKAWITSKATETELINPQVFAFDLLPQAQHEDVPPPEDDMDDTPPPTPQRPTTRAAAKRGRSE